MHAREWGGSDICVAFATNLLKSYAARVPLKYGNKSFTAAQVATILEKLDLFVFPDVNPDGKAFSQSTDPAGGRRTSGGGRTGTRMPAYRVGRRAWTSTVTAS
jgi:murein tripeptide amidase MpaA